MDQWCNFLFFFFSFFFLQNEEKSESYLLKLFIWIRKIKILSNYISEFEGLEFSQFIYFNLKEFGHVIMRDYLWSLPISIHLQSHTQILSNSNK